MPNDNTSLDLLAAYLGKKPQDLLKNRPFRNKILELIYGATSGGGGGAVSSVFTRTGAIVATTGDYTFAQIGSTPTTILGYGITDAVSLTGVQTLTNKTLTSPTLTTPVLGTPASGNLSNCTNIPLSGITGLGTGVATFLGTPSSVNLASAVTDETGTGLLVFATSPVLTTPNIGVATATTVNKVTITTPATSATLTLVQGSTLATSGAFSTTLTATATTNVTLPTLGTLISTVASGSVSSVATLDINFSAYIAQFSFIEVRLISVVPATNAATLQCRLSTDGTTFATTGYKWNFMYSVAAANGGLDDAGTNTGFIQLTGSSSNTTTNTINGTVNIFNPNSSSVFPQVNFTTSRYNDTPATAILTGMGLITTAQVTKGIRFLFSSGNIASATYRVIGYV